MGGFTAETTIDRPVGDVWAALTDWSTAHHWMAGLDDVRADGPTVAGTTITFRTRGKDRTSTITEARDRSSVTLRSIQGGVTADYRYALADSDGSTTVSLEATCTARGLWRPLCGIIARAMARADGGQLDALKATVEARP